MACLVSLPQLLTAQRYNFKRYDQDSGLPNLDVRALLQDRTGFLWVGTDNGLYRYDGHHFRTFAVADGLPSSQITALAAAPEGTLWVATESGLARLRGERFEKVLISPGVRALSLAADSQRLYVGSALGLHVAANPGWATRSPLFEFYTPPGVRSHAVHGIAVSPSGAVWFGCGTQLCRMEGGRVTSLPAWGVPEDIWQGLAIDLAGNIWARSCTRLIELPNGETRFLPRDRDLPPASTRGRLLLGRDGQLWVPTMRGLARRTPTGWEVIGRSRGLPICRERCCHGTLTAESMALGRSPKRAEVNSGP